ncbi:polymorphic toxin type 47 domain-containing protein, partial [Apibacter muscae]|uniref:polymorphic toxin type 47 domain-containing protein n=1 Tax=Apibacter muscae TaxID=2509004 RepID=UPI001FEA8A91
NRFRYYNPETGQYISKDPIGLAGNNPNSYAYTHDSNTMVDTLGLMAQPKGTGLNWNEGKLGPNDLDLRGTGSSLQDALDIAFEKTGIPKDQFTVTKWAEVKTEYGKSIPVEWYHKPSKSEVNIDLPHLDGFDKNGVWGTGPDAPHVGWQTGKKKDKKVGHILIDDTKVDGVDVGRTKIKCPY